MGWIWARGMMEGSCATGILLRKEKEKKNVCCRGHRVIIVPGMSSSRVWFITGCSSGFGRVISEHVLRSGDVLFATARKEAALADLATVGAERCATWALDITKKNQADAAVQACVQRFGRIDVLFNNAGYGLLGALEETSETEEMDCYEANLFGALRLTRAALPMMRMQTAEAANPRPVVLFNTAIAVFHNAPGFTAYSGAKAALEATADSLAKELTPTGIQVATVVLGPFRTNWIGTGLQRASQSIPAYEQTVGRFGKFLESINGKQPGDPQKAAGFIVQALQSGKLPRRLIYGKYAVNGIEHHLSGLKANLDLVRADALASDFQ